MPFKLTALSKRLRFPRRPDQRRGRENAGALVTSSTTKDVFVTVEVPEWSKALT